MCGDLRHTDHSPHQNKSQTIPQSPRTAPSICLLHIGGALIDDDIDNLKLNITRVQFAIDNPLDFEEIRQQFNIIKLSQTGKVIEFTAREKQDYILEKLESINPAFVEVLPLTLEEVFISEMEVAGYDINKILA